MNSFPRLILISGWAHDASAMEDLRKCLESKADIISVATGDLWSAGTETSPQGSYARNLAGLIEKTGGPVFIAGWSLGGMIAMETAARHPDLFAGLVLISTTLKFCSGRNWATGVPPAALRAMRVTLKRDPRGVFEVFFKNTAFPFKENKRTMTFRIDKASTMNPLELSAGLEYLSATDLRNDAAKINIPALILHGKQDLIIPVEAGLALKNLLPASGIRIYENFGHGLPWQNPQAVAGEITEFLGKCRNRNTKQIHP